MKGHSDYYCLCKMGFEGRDCEITKPDLCKANPCENEGGKK